MRRWIVGGALLLAFALLIGWIARNTYWEEITLRRAPRGEAARNPFYGVQRLATELGARAEWRRSLGELPDHHDALLVLAHWHWDLIDTRRAELERWVESGGRLLLDGSLAGGEEALAEWSGLRMQIEADTADHWLAGPSFDAYAHCWDLDLTTGHSVTKPGRDSYTICGLRTSGAIASTTPLEWAAEDADGIQAARVRVGQGWVILINGQPFRTHEILRDDNGVLFVDVTSLRRGDHVIFVSDEQHHSLPALIWLHGAPAVLLASALIALVLWRNSVRFGPLLAPLESPRRSLAEQIRGTGRFLLRVDGGRALHAAMVRALHEAARAKIASYDELSADARIAAVARISGIEADLLADTVSFAGHCTRHELKSAVALLDRACSALRAHAASRSQSRRRGVYVETS